MEVKRQIEEQLTSLRSDPFLTSNYQLLELMGEGCFGKIVKAINKRSGQTIALKIERFRKAKFKMVLKKETEILTKLQGRKGIPRIYRYGEWESGSYLEMELLSHDLNSFRQYSPTEISELALKAIRILEGVHSAKIVHQDLKPHNFMRGQQDDLFLIDFGLARQLPIKQKSSSLRGFIGTPRYASIRAHNMLEQGKKDDLESLFYTFAYLYYQRLPWSKLNISSDQRIQKIKLLKIMHKSSLFNEMPPQFERAFEYITSLQCYADPDYSLLKSYFKRSKTILFEPKLFITKEEQSKVKRVSLNSNKYLQVPISQLHKERINKKQKSEKKDHLSYSLVSSHTQVSASSDMVQNNMLEVQQNFKEDQNIEPVIPFSAKFGLSLVLKNPFV